MKKAKPFVVPFVVLVLSLRMAVYPRIVMCLEFALKKFHVQQQWLARIPLPAS